jgi:hypothetical protein
VLSDDLQGLGVEDWHTSVPVDNTQYVPSLILLEVNTRDLAGTRHWTSPTGNRIALIEKVARLMSMGINNDGT